MRIAMLGVKTLPSASGVEKVVEEIGSRLVQRGHEVTVFTRAHLAGTTLPSEYRGIRVRPTWSVPTKHFDAATHALAAALAMSGKTDVLHVHTTNFAPAVALSKVRGIPVVVQSHGLDWKRSKWGRLASAYLQSSDAMSRHWSDALVVVSKTLERAYGQMSGCSPIYVPNGVARWHAESKAELAPLGLADKRYVLFAARLVPEKGCHVLIEAFRRLAPADVELVIAGNDLYDGAYARELKNSAGGGVRFVGAVLGPAFRALVQQAEVFVLPSDIEGLSTGLLEAMAARKCIIASNLPENMEAVGDTALTFPPGSAEQLASRLSRVLGDPALRAVMGEAAARRVFDEYDWDASTRMLERIYQQVAAGSHKRERPASSLAGS
jgi:glycosyltransferase involved in cell wall biosynthesis